MRGNGISVLERVSMFSRENARYGDGRGVRGQTRELYAAPIDGVTITTIYVQKN